MDYDFEIPRICEEIKKRNAKRVLIQLPEGIKVHSKQIADEITEKTCCEVIISGDPCFGACDIQKLPECELTVHFAHSKMIDDPNTIYIECAYKKDLTSMVQNITGKLKGKKVGLVATVQHIHEISKIKELLKKNGIDVFVGKKGALCAHDSQVLGCDAGSAIDVKDKVDIFLFIGSGEFHPLLVAYETKKPVLKLNPYTDKTDIVNADSWEKEKHLRMDKAHDANTLAVVVGTKPGQRHMNQAEDIKKKLESQGKKAYLVSMNNVTPEKIDYLPFDAFVITACQRIVMDDWKNYRKPLLLPDEIEGL